MILNIGCNITVEAQGPVPLSLILQPQSGAGQKVLSSQVTMTPPAYLHDFTDGFGNHCQRTLLQQGTTTFTFLGTVEVSDIMDISYGAPLTPVQDLPDEVLQYLLPSRYCQSDLFTENAASYTGNALMGYNQVDAIRQWIHDHVTYQYGASNESTSAVDTNRDLSGVCRDFAHLGIAITRALGIPARMVFGYLHGLDPMDLHAWFEAFVGGRWYTFDATQDGPRGNRVVIAYGRDAADIAQMSQYGPMEISAQNVWVNAA